jgi:hypothetical protein
MTHVKRVRCRESAAASGLRARNTIKLRGPPKATATKQRAKARCGQGSDLGYSNNAGDVTMDDPQPTPTPPRGRYGGSSTTRC